MDGEAVFCASYRDDQHHDQNRPARLAEPVITAAQLRFAMTAGRHPLVIDVRREAISRAARVIPSATWRDPNDVETWAKRLPTKRLIAVYCVHGHHVSRFVVASLRHLGFDAWRLDGGIAAWQAQGYPTEAKLSALNLWETAQ